MTHFSRESAIAVKHLSINNNTPANSASQRQHDEVLMTLACAIQKLSQRKHVGIIVDHHRKLNCLPKQTKHFHILPFTKIGRAENYTALTINDPRDAQPATRHRFCNLLLHDGNVFAYQAGNAIGRLFCTNRNRRLGLNVPILPNNANTKVGPAKINTDRVLIIHNHLTYAAEAQRTANYAAETQRRREMQLIFKKRHRGAEKYNLHFKYATEMQNLLCLNFNFAFLCVSVADLKNYFETKAANIPPAIVVSNSIPIPQQSINGKKTAKAERP
jgi:hypothetical protein